MSLIRFGWFVGGFVGVWLFACVWFFLLLRRFGSGSYFLTPLFEFIQGDLCLSAHTAPVPVQKNPESPPTARPARLSRKTREQLRLLPPKQPHSQDRKGPWQSSPKQPNQPWISSRGALNKG